jgi:hypothetical protein
MIRFTSVVVVVSLLVLSSIGAAQDKLQARIGYLSSLSPSESEEASRRSGQSSASSAMSKGRICTSTTDMPMASSTSSVTSPPTWSASRST